MTDILFAMKLSAKVAERLNEKRGNCIALAAKHYQGKDDPHSKAMIDALDDIADLEFMTIESLTAGELIEMIDEVTQDRQS